jgi:large subunit ribosomal protein L25
MVQQQPQVRLIARPRSILGKRVKQLRRNGLLPAVLWDASRTSQPLVLETRAMQMALHGYDPGATVPVTLSIDGQDVPALVREVKRDPITGELLHVSFYRLVQDRPVRAKVPLVFVGEAPAVRQGGLLVHPTDTLEVEALPRDLPEAISIDLSILTELDQALTAGELTLPAGVRLLTDPNTLVVKVQPPKGAVEEVKPAAPQVAVAPAGPPKAAGETRQPAA